MGRLTRGSVVVVVVENATNVGKENQKRKRGKKKDEGTPRRTNTPRAGVRSVWRKMEVVKNRRQKMQKRREGVWKKDGRERVDLAGLAGRQEQGVCHWVASRATLPYVCSSICMGALGHTTSPGGPQPAGGIQRGSSRLCSPHPDAVWPLARGSWRRTRHGTRTPSQRLARRYLH